MVDQTLMPSSDALASIKRDLDRFEAEPRLRMSVRDHYTHLTELAEKLRKLGIDDLVVDQQVIGIFERYRSQLMSVVSVSAPAPEMPSA